MSIGYALAMIAVAAVCTFATRVAPFLLFNGKKPIPPIIRYLGATLPPAVIALLVVYCLKNVGWVTGTHGVPELLCIALTAVSISFVHAITARLKIEQIFKYYWTVVSCLALISLVLAWYGM